MSHPIGAVAGVTLRADLNGGQSEHLNGEVIRFDDQWIVLKNSHNNREHWVPRASVFAMTTDLR